MLFSPTTCGFYDPDINLVIPDDAVVINDDLYAELLLGNSRGMIISSDKHGYPCLVSPEPPSVEYLAEVERAWRDVQLSVTDALVARHRDELEEGGSTYLTAEQYAELQAYRRQLRDWPQGSQFPLAEHRPIAPPWLIEQVQ
ncbi:phage tail assembly chaperone [Pseudomonas sp. DR 5-09]|uniref:phage tail assembly chaperone n=1 Tax=Pseudomonas sp. DR 5-09 TaxID=1534110 RepID=UPI000B26B164|nr:phage tail assembly chaperone [Pseudomonas sp. DR 5-09]